MPSDRPDEPGDALARALTDCLALRDTVLQRLFGLAVSLQALQLDSTLGESSQHCIARLLDDLDVTVGLIRMSNDAGRGWLFDGRPMN